eukprot:CAMPEP_0115198628 /NCGR_PEP_ID=MMETSP0270-20121206/16203_1 /TAXON_ID=71861 /ORGANISM="Scrippsiella trochoidea, Strain CCMP3099" /LENGTH=731 /DNA_ID=CAMNT_0002612005 /DNA_START=27 /DNA_END=2218 /DNA_ORIENTATION=-
MAVLGRHSDLPESVRVAYTAAPCHQQACGLRRAVTVPAPGAQIQGIPQHVHHVQLIRSSTLGAACPLQRCSTVDAVVARGSASGSSGVAVHRALGHQLVEESVVKMSPAENGQIEGLRDFLLARGLEQHHDAVVDWCKEMGAAFLEEVVSNISNLADDLHLSPEDRGKLFAERDGHVDAAPAPHVAASPAPVVAVEAAKAETRVCPACNGTDTLGFGVSIGAQHEGWGRKWNECIYACQVCRRLIRNGASVTVCKSCKVFWHPNCEEAHAHDKYLATIAGRLQLSAHRESQKTPFQKLHEQNRIAANKIIGHRIGIPRYIVNTRGSFPSGSAPKSKKISVLGGSKLQPALVVAPSILAQATTEAKALKRATTMMLAGAPSNASLASPTGNAFLQGRTTSSPITGVECQAAAHRASAAYVPLRAWPRKQAAKPEPRQCKAAAEKEVLSKNEQLVEGTEPLPSQGQRIGDMLSRDLRYWRRGYVEPTLLRARVPSAEELRDPFWEEAAADREARREARMAERQSFEEIRRQFLVQHREAITESLAPHVDGPIEFRPAPVAQHVQQRFIDSTREVDGELVPTYHGSLAENYSSICQRGLLIPGRQNELEVVNGAVHGRGIYTARVDAPSLSINFCSDPRMLVCGVLDDADPLACHQAMYGGHSLSAQSQTIKHVGDAVVVFDERRVVPLFEVSANKFHRYRNWGQKSQAPQNLIAWRGNKPPSAPHAAPPVLIP